MKNTVTGSVLVVVLGGFMTLMFNASERSQKQNAELVAVQTEMSKHIVRIETILEVNSAQVPPLVEGKLQELRDRINLHEARMNELDSEVGIKTYRRSNTATPGKQ